MKQRIVFACSGSVENGAAIPWLAATFDAEIVAMTLDVGQGGDLEAVRHAAIAAGAVRAHVLDVREQFARNCIVASLTGDDGEETAPGHAAATPLIARKLVEIAGIEGADAIAHGGDAADHDTIERTARALNPSLCVIAAATPVATPHGARTTLWGRSGSPAERSTRIAEVPAHLEISFEAGLPVAINGVPMTLTEVVESVATIAGTHGVGRVTDSTSGAASHAPAAVVFHAARTALGSAAVDAPAATVRVELFKGQHRVVSAHHS